MGRARLLPVGTMRLVGASGLVDEDGDGNGQGFA
jgi:hypothetical protein